MAIFFYFITGAKLLVANNPKFSKNRNVTSQLAFQSWSVKLPIPLYNMAVNRKSYFVFSPYIFSNYACKITYEHNYIWKS